MYVCMCVIFCLLSFVLNYKEIHRLSKNKHFILGTVLLLLPLLVVIAFVTLLTFIIFKLYREIVRVILKFKYGASFLGFFENQDGLNVSSPNARCLINVLLVIECLEDRHKSESIFETVCNSIDEVIIKNGTRLPKFASTYDNFMGYTYMKGKPCINLLNCVKKMKTINANRTISKMELMEIVGDYSSEPLPYNNQLMWDVYVGMQPLKWKEDSKNAHYPILFRFHHSLADAVIITEFISGVFGYNANNERSQMWVKRTPSFFGIFLQGVLHWTNIFFYFPAAMYNLLIIKKMFSINSRYDRKFKKGLVALYVEDFKDYLPKIRTIRKKYNSTFTSILTTAFSDALKEYYEKHNMTPDHETAVIPFHPKALSLQHLTPGSINVDDIDFRNAYNMEYLTLPISPKQFECDEKSLNKLTLITDNLKLQMNSKTSNALRSFMNLYNTLAPLPWTCFFADLVTFGPCISNIPLSLKKIKFADNYLSICDYFFFVPDQVFVSFSLFVGSYDERLQLALTVTNRGCSMDDAQWIVNKFLEYIDKLHNAINI